MLIGRLRDVPDRDRAILDAAAVQGFEFDGDLVARVLRRERLEVLQVLAGLARRHGLVRSRGARFTFDHHLLHELVHAEIPDALLAEYHSALADAHAQAKGLVGKSPGEVPGEDAVFLATHLLRAGRGSEGAEFVLPAFEHLAASAQIGSVIRLAGLVARAPGARGEKTEDAPPTFSGLRRARWHSHLGDAHWTGGDFDGAESHLDAALAALGVRVPASGMARKLFLARQALRQAAHLVLPDSVVRSRRSQREKLREAARTAGLVAMMQVYRSRPLDVLLYSMLAVNMAERAATNSVFSLGLLGFTASSLKLRRLGQRYFARARGVGRVGRDRRELIHAMKFEAVVLFGRGHLADAAARVQECLDLSRDLGFALGTAEAHGMFALIEETRGRFEDAATACLIPLTTPGAEASGKHRFFYEHRLARVRLIQGRLDDAAGFVEAARQHVATDDHLALAMQKGIEARLATATGDHATAVAFAVEAGREIGDHEAGVPSPCRGAIEDPALALLDAWSEAAQSGRGPTGILREATAGALRRAHRFARLHPVCRPAALVIAGRGELLAGRRDRATAHWREAVTLARRIGLLKDEAEAHIELARLAPPGQARNDHALNALRLFESMKLVEAAREAEAILAES
jgi:tetratricopeptide (TPR) repeat protein